MRYLNLLLLNQRQPQPQLQPQPLQLLLLKNRKAVEVVEVEVEEEEVTVEVTEKIKETENPGNQERVARTVVEGEVVAEVVVLVMTTATGNKVPAVMSNKVDKVAAVGAADVVAVLDMRTERPAKNRVAKVMSSNKVVAEEDADEVAVVVAEVAAVAAVVASNKSNLLKSLQPLRPQKR